MPHCFDTMTFSLTGTSVMKVTASDADDPTYGSSARVVYSVLDGEKFFTVDRNTGKDRLPTEHNVIEDDDSLIQCIAQSKNSL